MNAWLWLPHWADKIGDLLDANGRPAKPMYQPTIIMGEIKPQPIVSNQYPDAPRGKWIKVAIHRTDAIDALSDLAAADASEQ